MNNAASNLHTGWRPYAAVSFAVGFLLLLVLVVGAAAAVLS